MTRIPRNDRVRPVPGLQLAACAGVLCLSATSWAQAPAWVRTWDGARTGVTAPPRDIASTALADGSGGVYVLGGSVSNANTPVPPPLPPSPARFLSHDDVAVVRLSPRGEVLWSLNQRDEARRVWQESRRRDAGNEVLRETLARLRVDL